MAIKIDETSLLPQLERFASKNRPKYKENSVSLGREAIQVAQGWFDSEPWKNGPIENFNTQQECRIELKKYILSNLDVADKDRHWFVPSFVWIFIARIVITYVVKLIIERYWPDLMTEMGLDI